MQVRKKDIRDLSYVTDVFIEGCPLFLHRMPQGGFDIGMLSVGRIAGAI